MSILVRRLTLRNYKSIANASVDLSDLTTLVGPNGAGKSNLIDALRFIADSLNTTLDLAMRQRGGIGEVGVTLQATLTTSQSGCGCGSASIGRPRTRSG